MEKGVNKLFRKRKICFCQICAEYAARAWWLACVTPYVFLGKREQWRLENGSGSSGWC